LSIRAAAHIGPFIRSKIAHKFPGRGTKITAAV